MLTERSRPVDDFDIFLSHTWLTDGKWKVLSLTMSSCWGKWLASWLLLVATAVILCYLEILPMTGRWHVETMGFQLDCPLGGWVIAASCLAPVLGVSISMMVPDCLVKSPMCFLDVVSIHQTDMELMERGVYGLGGFLQVSKELRALPARANLHSTVYRNSFCCVKSRRERRKAFLSSRNCSCVAFRSLVECSLPYEALVRLLVRHKASFAQKIRRL